MDINNEKLQAAKPQERREDTDEDEDEKDAQSVNIEPGESCASTDCLDVSLSAGAKKANRDRESAKAEDTDEDGDVSLHIVSSVRELRPPLTLLSLKGTHTTVTATESVECVASVAKMDKHVSFQQSIEELVIPTLSTSKVVENVREYVKQIESRLDDAESTAGTLAHYVTSPQPSAAQIVDLPRETLTLETIMGASELSFTSKLSDDSAALDEIERMAHDEVDRIVAENLAPTPASRTGDERPDFHKVERENREIAERFRQIMEMFDSFTKNLESLEMPSITPVEEVSDKSTLKLHRRLSFKGARSAEVNTAAHVGAAPSGSVYNEFYLELHGDHKDAAALAATAERSTPRLVRNFYNVPSNSAQPEKLEAALDPKCRDIATTISGLELHNEEPQGSFSKNQRSNKLSARGEQSLTTIGCQTYSDYFEPQVTPSTSSSFAAKYYSHSADDIVNALVIDSIADTATTTTAGAGTTSFTDATDITVIQSSSKILGTSDRTTVLKIREPSPIIDLAQEPSAARVTSVITDAPADVTDAPCERTYHTIHIEAHPSPASSDLRRPPLCSRLWNVITDLCAAVCLCLQHKSTPTSSASSATAHRKSCERSASKSRRQFIVRCVSENEAVKREKSETESFRHVKASLLRRVYDVKACCCAF